MAIVYRLLALASGRKTMILAILRALLNRPERSIEIKERWDIICPIDHGLSSAIIYLESIGVDFNRISDEQSEGVVITRLQARTALIEFEAAIATELEAMKFHSYGIALHHAYFPAASPLESWVLEVEIHRCDLPAFLVSFSGYELLKVQSNRQYRRDLILGVCSKLSYLREYKIENSPSN